MGFFVVVVVVAPPPGALKLLIEREPSLIFVPQAASDAVD